MIGGEQQRNRSKQSELHCSKDPEKAVVQASAATNATAMANQTVNARRSNGLKSSLLQMPATEVTKPADATAIKIGSHVMVAAMGQAIVEEILRHTIRVTTAIAISITCALLSLSVCLTRSSQSTRISA